MFSKKERDYLCGKKTTKPYGYVIEHRIKKKLQGYYRLEIPLILQNTKLTEFYKALTKNANDKATLYQNYKGEEGIRTPIDSLCRRTHSRSATSPTKNGRSNNN